MIWPRRSNASRGAATVCWPERTGRSPTNGSRCSGSPAASAGRVGVPHFRQSCSAAQHLDRGDDLLTLGQVRISTKLSTISSKSRDHPGRIADCRSSPATGERASAASLRNVLYKNIGINVSIGAGYEDSLTEPSDVSRRQQPIERRPDLIDQQVMHARPQLRVFQIRSMPGTGWAWRLSSRGNVDVNDGGSCYYRLLRRLGEWSAIVARVGVSCTTITGSRVFL